MRYSTFAHPAPRVKTLADGTTITPDADNFDVGIHANTQSAGTLTIAAPSGTPVDGQVHRLRIKCTNAQTPAWNAIYRGSDDGPLPSAFTVGKWDYFGLTYDAADTKWDVVALNKGF